MRLLTYQSVKLLEKAWNEATGDAGYRRHLAEQADDAQKEDPFDPANISDGRKRILREIVNRQGQPVFRNRILDAYGRRCAITGSNVIETLEAAHIFPYRGTQTNRVSNGILLRADLHILFDLGFISIDTSGYRVLVADRLKGSVYGRYSGQRLSGLAKRRASRSKPALDLHRKKAELARLFLAKDHALTAQESAN